MAESKLEEYERVYGEGKVIYEEGEVGDTVFLIKSGEVDILKGSGAEQRKLARLGAGELVGELALEQGEHERSATVKAACDVKGWRFPGPAFETLIEKKQEFRQKLIRALVDRLMDTTNRLAEQESAELKNLNQLLMQSAHAQLPDFSSEELENDETVRTKTVTHSDEYLAYRYDVDPALIDRFRSLNEGESLEDLDDEARIHLSDLAKDIVEDTTSKIKVTYPGEGEADEALVQAAREAKNLLEKLEDHTETYDNDELQAMMERRKDFVEVLEETRENGRDDFLVNRLEKLLTGIKQELNIRYE